MIGQRLMVAVLSCLLGLGGLLSTGVASDARVLGTVRISAQNEAGDLLPGACYVVEQPQLEREAVLGVCDNDSGALRFFSVLFDSDPTPGVVEIGVIPADLVIREVWPPDGFELRERQQAVSLAEINQALERDGAVEVHFTHEAFQSVDNGADSKDEDGDDIATLEARIATLEALIDTQQATIDYLIGASGATLPQPLDPELDMTVFGNMIFSSGSIPAEKSFTLYCRYYEAGRPGELLLHCGWFPYLFP
jgi:hypothetical protein